MELEKIPSTTLSFNGTNYLYFSGTSYLGVAALPEFQEIVIKNILKWGTSYGSSRNANVQLNIYKKAESFIANFLQKEDCVTVSSGTLAGLFSLRSLTKLVDDFYFMPKTHPAILTENAKPVFENSIFNSELNTLKNKTICILADGIAALETQPFSYQFLDKIDPSNTIYLLIDESHSLGVLGKNGCGISTEISTKENVQIIVTSSLGKSYGINGGIIAGSKNFIASIKNDPLFVGSAGMSPAYLETFLEAQAIYKSQLKKLRKNINILYDALNLNTEIRIDSSYPVFFHQKEKIEDYLLSKNIIITSFYYPTSTKKFNRIVLNANHTKEQLSTLEQCLK
ncbi:MAG: aminotransferase class I/II-fold pyridoxal phosphate-dependent enzyme [Polaribacter sp.]